MRLTLYTDYSLRVLMYLAKKENNQLTTIKEIAEFYQISNNHLMKVIYHLGQLGYITTIRGRGGGIQLNLSPSSIYIGKVIRDTEEDLHLVECFDPKTNTCKLGPDCKLKHALSEALQAYLSVLDTYTLEMVTQTNSPLTNLRDDFFR